MTGLLIKLFVCPAVLLISNAIFQEVSYGSYYQAIITGFVLAAAAHFMELFILKPGTMLVSTLVDLISAYVIVYLSQFVFQGTVITLSGAFIVSVILVVTEYAQHLYLIQYGKTKKGT